MQAGVYELIRDDGTVDKVKVLKAKHRYALLTKMQREWEVGRRISSLKSPERAMPGFHECRRGCVYRQGRLQRLVM